MKSLVCALAGVGVVLALAAGPSAAQGRPGGGGGGGHPAAIDGAGVAGAHVGSAPASGGGMAVPRAGSSGASSGGGYMAPAAGSSSGAPAGMRGGSGGGSWMTNPANGNSPVVQRLYGSSADSAVPRGSRPGLGATPYVGTGGRVAVPRDPSPVSRGGRRPPVLPGGGGDTNWAYNPWIFAGLGFYNVLYADPYWLTGYWFPYDYGYDYDPTWDPGAPPLSPGAGDDQLGMGGLKLKIQPPTAEVLVDGYFVGTVDKFNGAFQKLDLPAGPHHVEVRAPGYQSITFDVRIDPGQNVTYRGELRSVAANQ